MKQALSLSIVIPVYNEENHLQDCLTSIQRQTIQPDEVIVVNNNSTDKSVEIAEKFEFVKILNETQQGLIPSRNTGFDAAKSDLLGRINADAVLDAKWVESVKNRFTQEQFGGMSGPAMTKILPGINWLHFGFWSNVYLISTKAYFRTPVMWGANMAITAEIWKKIKPQADLEDSYVHEDQDISLLIAGNGGKILIDQNLKIYTNKQSYFYWPKFREYAIRRWRTKAHHKQVGTYKKIDKTPFIFTLLVWLALFIPVAVFIMCSFVFYKIGQILIKVSQ